MNRRTFAKLSALSLALLFTISSAAQTTAPWLTRSADNQRSGWNNKETVLSQASVAKGIFLKTTIPVGGDARGIEAQPLILPAVQTARGLRDVMVLCSMANQCRGVDVHDGSAIWDVTLGTPVTSNPSIDMWGISDHIGALSTGVIDAADQRFYQVYWSSPDGSPRAGRYYMAVLNVRDGSQVVPPVMIAGKSQGYDFNQAMRKARSSAVLLNQNGVRTVLQCTGTVTETTQGAAGFCFAFDTYTNRITAMITTTAGEGAGIWQAGQGLSCPNDNSGICYAITGNGDWDGVTQFGEAFIQLQYSPPTATTAAIFKINKGYSPYTDRQRSGQDQAPAGKLAGESLPSESVRPVGWGMPSPMDGGRLVAKLSMETGAPVTLVYPDMATGGWSDEDWGSAGPACLFQLGVCVATGKDGLGFVLPVPGFTATTAKTVGTITNCRYANPTWLTMSPGNVDPCPANPRALNFFPQGDTAHLHMTPVQMYDPLLKSWTIFVWGENQQLHKWKVGAGGKLTWVANGHEFASANVRGNPPGGMDGGFCTGSSNGGDANSAILVCTYPLTDANRMISPGVITIYDPIHLGADGYLKKLWSSADWGWNFTFNKFLPPVIDAGQIYVGNFSGGVMVLGGM